MTDKKKRASKEKHEDTSTKYVCLKEDLDLLLPKRLKFEFQSLFYKFPVDSFSNWSDAEQPDPNTTPKRKEAWRMFYKNGDPRKFLNRFGIDFDNPTVRDAVAFDLVKLDDDSVSNDWEYTYWEHVGWSPREYERFLLNKNFRINLVNLDPEWSRVVPRGTPEEERGEKAVVKRTVERMYQGVQMSKTMLDFFGAVFKKMQTSSVVPTSSSFWGDVYVPFTNSNDFITEMSLVPNTHHNFRPTTSRAYYDMQHGKWKELLFKHGIHSISSFALVDPSNDKNHTGWFRLKIQRKLDDDNYLCIVCDISKDGQFRRDKDGNLDIKLFKTKDNTILCVCEDDFLETRVVPTEPGVWTPVIRDIPMVKSTTSSHYSIFRQRIPDYDLKQVRHYLQFKNRLEGMELCLWELNRSIYLKEVQASECFAKETMAIWRLFQEFSKNEAIMKLVMEYYGLLDEWDSLVLKRRGLVRLRDGKLDILGRLQDEYNALPTTKMDAKLELGQKIKSIKLEIGKNIGGGIAAIDNRLRGKGGIQDEVRRINEDILTIQGRTKPLPIEPEDLKSAFNDGNMSKALADLKDKKNMLKESMGLEIERKPHIDSTLGGLVDEVVYPLQHLEFPPFPEDDQMQ